MRGLPALIRASHYPAIDVQAIPKAALATGKFEAQKKPALTRALVLNLNYSHSNGNTSEGRMPKLRTFEISYTKNGERNTFSVQTENFYDHEEWRLVASRFYLSHSDDQAEGEALQTWKSLCEDAGYTDVTFVEIP